MNNDLVAQRIRSFLVHQFPATKNVSDDDVLLENGLIDSLGILEVVTFLEKQFNLAITDEDLSPANFATVRRIAAFIQEKKPS